MSFPDPQPPFMSSSPFPNSSMDPMGFWPSQIPTGSTNQHAQFDIPPPFKRPKISEDGSSHSQFSGPMNSGIPQTNPPTNKSIGRIFYKTRVCYRFSKGGCPNGDNCNFAHGEMDLRKPPPNWEELVGHRPEDRGGGVGGGGGGGVSGGNRDGNGTWDDNDDRSIQRMKICKKYYNGEECPYGERCNFIHRDPPQKPREIPGRFRDGGPRESAAISIGTTIRPSVMQGTAVDHHFNGNRLVDPSADLSQGNMRPVFYKTRICTKWEMGVCPYGEKCHYAHGQAELQGHGHHRVGDSEPLNPTFVAVKSTPAPTIVPIIEKIENGGALSNQEGQGKKCLVKWKTTKKINRIYADWINDQPLLLPDNFDG
ncbi:hypothetical protein Dimus_023528 [Dionaea muscipula]